MTELVAVVTDRDSDCLRVSSAAFTISFGASTRVAMVAPVG